jgi:quercetin dioxygenase-like cupin family protein
MMQKFLVAGLEPSQHNFPPVKNVLTSEATSERHVFGVLRGGLNVIVEGHAMQIRMGDIVRLPAGVCCEVQTDATSGALCLHSAESVGAQTLDTSIR